MAETEGFEPSLFGWVRPFKLLNYFFRRPANFAVQNQLTESRQRKNSIYPTISMTNVFGVMSALAQVLHSSRIEPTSEESRRQADIPLLDPVS